MKSNLKKYLYPSFLLLAIVVVGMVCQPVFYLNDDITMRSILSGAYTGTPNGHAVYMQYPLTGVLALLYRVLPVLPWMELFFAGCIWGCMSLLASEFSNNILGCLSAAVLFMPFYCYMHYTIIAALVAGCAVFLLCRGKKVSCAWVLVWIAYMIRSQIGLLALPFVMAAYVWRMINVSKGEWKQKVLVYIKQISVLLLGMLFITGINKLCYSSEVWQEYISYNDSRTKLYDYTDFVSTDKYAATYAEYGMTEKEYQILFSYNTMLENTIDVSKMQGIADKVAAGMQKNNTGLQGIKDSVKKYYLQVRYGDTPYNIIWIVGFMGLAVCMIWQKKWLQLGFLGILGVGRSLVWVFLIGQGRFPERVSLSLYMIELLLLLGVGLQLGSRLGKCGRIQLVMSILCTILVCGVGCYVAKDTYQKVTMRLQVQTDWDVLKAYFETHEENTYLMDVYSSVRFSDKLYEKDVANLMLLGGWLTKSPLAQSRLNDLHCEDAAEALRYGEQVYLVTDTEDKTGWMEEYLQERFGDCSLQQIDTLALEKESFFIYQVVSTE